MDIKSLLKKARDTVKSKTIPFIKLRKKLIAITAAVTVMVMLMSFVMIRRNDVTVYVDGQKTENFVTLESDSNKWIEISGVEVFDGDVIEVKDTDVYITRAYYATVQADGIKITLKTTPCTVAQLLEKTKISVGENDIVNFSLEDTVTADSVITVSRVLSDTVVETEAIEYETIKKKTDDLYEGETKVETEGENGKKEYTYSVTYTDGVETERTLIKEETVKEPVDKVVLVGTKVKSSFIKTSSTPSSYKAVYSMRASAYTYGEDGGNYTATGEKCRRGIVAVDPSVIPLGTKLYIESADGKYIYGEAVAGDTGGSIKGMKIDVFVESKSECYSFGRRDVNVYILY